MSRMWWLALSACLVQESAYSTGSDAEVRSLYPAMPPGAALTRAQQVAERLGWTGCTREPPGGVVCQDVGWRGAPDRVELSAAAYGPRFARVTVRSSGPAPWGRNTRHKARVLAFVAAWDAAPGRTLQDDDDPHAP